MSGNCGCSKCGLRGYSKNVTCRNVFPIFDDFVYLESYERNTKLIIKEDQPFWTFRRFNYATDKDMTFSEVLKELIARSDFKSEHLDILFCEHDWVQDPGTETV